VLVIETVLMPIVLLIAFVRPTVGSRWLERLERLFSSAAQRRSLSVIFVGIAAIITRLCVLPLLPIPSPGIPDEFGHLFAGDTFAHFRLTNVTHPMWVHFENLTEIQRPSHASKYPPAQGFVLALGQILFGHPFWGVCLSVGLMCGAICWMLQAWLPPQWALLGGILAVIRLAAFSYWANSYWGGAVAALGGALVLGAVPRIKAGERLHHTLLMAVGLTILANSRPYEGLVLAVVLTLSLAVSMGMGRRHFYTTSRGLRRIAFPFLGFTMLTAIAMGYYCWRVTGNPLKTPYQVAQSTYYPTPLFVFQKLRPTPQYHDPVMQASFEKWELPVYMIDRQHPIITAEAKALHFWFFFLGPALSTPFVLLLLALPHNFSWHDISPGTRLLLPVAISSFVAVLLTLRFNPGYAAPSTAVIYALLMKSLRRVRVWQPGGKQTGVAFSRGIVLTCFLLLLVRAAAGPLHVVPHGVRTWSSLDFQLTDRANFQSFLASFGGTHLVIVRRSEVDSRNGTEWVFNDADIDNSRVVWARDLGPEQNEELIHYFKNRRIWLAEPDVIPPRLSPYPTQ
jgi:hypothetical protein